MIDLLIPLPLPLCLRCEALGEASTTGAWLYALLARLEKPLHPDVGSALRTLALVASRQRRDLVEGENRELGPVNGLSLIVCLVARYFNQRDLAD